jgi:hypothetical protein
MSKDTSVNEYYDRLFVQLAERIGALEKKFHVEHVITTNGVIHGPVSGSEESMAAVFLGVSLEKANMVLTFFARGRGIL